MVGLVPVAAMLLWGVVDNGFQLNLMGRLPISVLLVLGMAVLVAPLGVMVGAGWGRPDALPVNLRNLAARLGGVAPPSSAQVDLAELGEPSYSPREPARVVWKGVLDGREVQAEQVLERECSGSTNQPRHYRTIYRAFGPSRRRGAIVLGTEADFVIPSVGERITNLDEGDLNRVYPERREVQGFTLWGATRHDLDELEGLLGEPVLRLFQETVKGGALVFSEGSVSARVRFNALHTVVFERNRFDPALAERLLRGLVRLAGA